MKIMVLVKQVPDVNAIRFDNKESKVLDNITISNGTI